MPDSNRTIHSSYFIPPSPLLGLGTTRMAAVGVATASDALLGISSDFVRPDFHQVPLDLENWLQSEKKLRLSSDNQLCQLSLLPPGCPLGIACPLRHVENLPPKEIPKNSDIVCRHWLRGMCKLHEACPFLHSYDLRAFSKCYLYTTFKRCEIGYVLCAIALWTHTDSSTALNAFISTLVMKIGWATVQTTIGGSALADRTASRTMSDGLFAPRTWLDTALAARTANINSEYARKFPFFDRLLITCTLSPSPSRPPPHAYDIPPIPDPTDRSIQLPPVPAGYGRSLRAYDASQTVVQDRTAQLGGALSAWREGGGMLSVNARRNDQDGGPPPRRGGDRGDRGDRPKKWVSASDLDSVLCFVSANSFLGN